jgi:deoxyribonuclease V
VIDGISLGPSPPRRPTTAEARALQESLRDRLVLRAPADFAPELVAGADVSASRRSPTVFGGISVLDACTLTIVEEVAVNARADFPYVPGLLSFRELPVLHLAWERLSHRPGVVIFDGHGIAHPRGFGLACHGGLLLEVPTIGCAKSILVGEHGPLGAARGSTSPLRFRDQVVGMAVRTREGVKPVFVSPGHLMDLDTAVETVLRVAQRFREPETTRRAHRLVNRARIAALASGGGG